MSTSEPAVREMKPIMCHRSHWLTSLISCRTFKKLRFTPHNIAHVVFLLRLLLASKRFSSSISPRLLRPIVANLTYQCQYRMYIWTVLSLVLLSRELIALLRSLFFMWISHSGWLQSTQRLDSRDKRPNNGRTRSYFWVVRERYMNYVLTSCKQNCSSGVRLIVQHQSALLIVPVKLLSIDFKSYK